MKHTNNPLFIVIFLLGTNIAVFAKNDIPLTPKELAPDWVHMQLPERTNSEYFYQLITIEDAASRSEAEDKAERLAYQTAAKNQGIYIDASTMKVSEMEKKIFLHLACTYKEKKQEKYVYYFLYQISESGRQKPQYDNCDCYSTQLGREQRRKQIYRSNSKAITASAFIPGVGQMLKGEGGKGTAFLVSEIILFGGGATCYFFGRNQLETMKAVGTTYEQYTHAKNMKNIFNITMYTCFGLGTALHIGNMIHAWYVKDKHLLARYAFAPAIISTNEFIQPSYAYGVGVQIQF